MFSIKRYKDELIDRLDTKGMADQVHLWKSAANIRYEMSLVAGLTDDPEKKLALLGTYYSLQYLRKLLRSVDILAFRTETSQDLTFTYRLFMMRVGIEFRELIEAYMENLINYFFGEMPRPEYVICGVGTRADQDDLDLGVIDDGSAARANLNLVISKINREMLKRAIPLHCYLSEHVGSHGFAASIQEYKKLLSKEIQDFVIITEMLSAWPIMGSWNLFNEFRTRVTALYYHSRRAVDRKHEAYLRGILGEVRNHLLYEIRTDSINPKSDALRMIKGILYAFKTIFDLEDAVTAWQIIDQLQKQNSRRKSIFKQLEISLTFFETFRFLYHLFVVQEEEIRLDEYASQTPFNAIARTMGYSDVGIIKPWDHLITHYYENLKQSKENIEVLLQDASDYLKGISTFYIQAEERQKIAVQNHHQYNLALDILRRTQFFRGTTFWDDFLESLEADDSRLLARFVNDFNRFPLKIKQTLIRNYARFADYTFYPIIELQNILWRNRKKVSSEQLFHDFSDAFLDKLENHYDVIWWMARIFTLYPLVINEFMSALPEPKVWRLLKLLEGDVWDPEIVKYRNRILNLGKIYAYSSEHFKRIFKNVITLTPKIVEHLDQPETISRIANGIFGTMDVAQSIGAKKKILAVYHDIEFFRISLETLNRKSFDEINENYIKFIDNYFQALFEVCKIEIDQKMASTIVTRDAVAIFASGGLAREQAYDDDWDFIIVVNSDDPGILNYVESIIAKMHHEIVKRGTMPHYRMADLFGKYVTPMSVLKKYLGSDYELAFIEKSQILGSRLLVGSRKFLEHFNNEIISKYIWQDKDKYIKRMTREIKERQADYVSRSLSMQNLKDCTGGLRDIELLMLIFKANFELDGPLNNNLIDIIISLIPQYRRKLVVLKKTFAFLKRLRDIYRLTVALENKLDKKYLSIAAQILGIRDSQTHLAVDRLMIKYYRRIHRSNCIINQILDEIEPTPGMSTGCNSLHDNIYDYIK